MDKGISVRQKKVAAVLQALAARFFIEEAPDWNLGAMVMVDEVFVPADVKSGQVWISFSPHDAKKAATRFEIVDKKTKELQNYIFRNMEIRRAPQVKLHLSDPDKTFKLIDIFGTLDSHAEDKPDDSRDPETE